MCRVAGCGQASTGPIFFGTPVTVVRLRHFRYNDRVGQGIDDVIRCRQSPAESLLPAVSGVVDDAADLHVTVSVFAGLRIVFCVVSASRVLYVLTTAPARTALPSSCRCRRSGKTVSHVSGAFSRICVVMNPCWFGLLGDPRSWGVRGGVPVHLRRAHDRIPVIQQGARPNHVNAVRAP